MPKTTVPNWIIPALLAAIMAGGAVLYLTRPDDRNLLQRMGDAVEELPNGVDKAGRALESRTPAEKIGDGARDLIKDK